MNKRAPKARSDSSERPCVLTVNGGSSSIKFALFEITTSPRRVLRGTIEGIGQARGTFTVAAANGGKESRAIAARDHTQAVAVLMDWVKDRIQAGNLVAVGHRLVHGGQEYWCPQRITPAMIRTLHDLSPFDPEHLPEEILLAEAFHRRFPRLPQIACFDTAFHHDLPRVARLLPIPRRYEAKGVRRYGFHGLSCSFLTDELARLEGRRAANGRVILAHLGNGASMTAVHRGRSIDTTMAFTPTAGLPMSSRAGDLDPGLAWYLARTEQITAHRYHHMVNHESGLLGISETSSDMRELLRRQRRDVRAAEAVALFCYQARKWLCALAGALEGLDHVIFAGGIGENAPEIRARICQGLEFIGIRLDQSRNRTNSPVISSRSSGVVVRVIRTDEERVIAQTVCRLLRGTAPGANGLRTPRP